MTDTHTFSATLWQWPSMEAWVFVTLPQDLSDAIREVPRPPKPGFGSIRVEVTAGATTWKTSIFPQKNDGPYMLPVKKAVRAAEGAEVGDAIELRLTTLD